MTTLAADRSRIDAQRILVSMMITFGLLTGLFAHRWLEDVLAATMAGGLTMLLLSPVLCIVTAPPDRRRR